MATSEDENLIAVQKAAIRSLRRDLEALQGNQRLLTEQRDAAVAREETAQAALDALREQTRAQTAERAEADRFSAQRWAEVIEKADAQRSSDQERLAMAEKRAETAESDLASFRAKVRDAVQLGADRRSLTICGVRVAADIVNGRGALELAEGRWKDLIR